MYLVNEEQILDLGRVVHFQEFANDEASVFFENGMFSTHWIEDDGGVLIASVYTPEVSFMADAAIVRFAETIEEAKAEQHNIVMTKAFAEFLENRKGGNDNGSV